MCILWMMAGAALALAILGFLAAAVEEHEEREKQEKLHDWYRGDS